MLINMLWYCCLEQNWSDSPQDGPIPWAGRPRMNYFCTLHFGRSPLASPSSEIRIAGLAPQYLTSAEIAWLFVLICYNINVSNGIESIESQDESILENYVRVGLITQKQGRRRTLPHNRLRRFSIFSGLIYNVEFMLNFIYWASSILLTILDPKVTVRRGQGVVFMI